MRDDRGQPVRPTRQARQFVELIPLPKRRIPLWFQLLPLTVIVPLGLIATAPIAYQFHLSKQLIVVAALLLTAAIIVVIRIANRRVVLPMRVQEVLDAGLCPGCKYEIYNVTADLDGCTVCPECGAAWRLPNTDPDAHKVDRA